MADIAAGNSRIKRWAILLVLASSGLVFLVWSQTWFNLTLVADVIGNRSIEVTGQQAASSLSAFAFCGLALGGALTIAGTVFRFVLGLLQFLLGVCVIVATASALSNPILGGAGSITEQTGISGAGSLESLVESSSTTPWPAVGIAVGVLVSVSGVLVLVTATRWPRSSRKYQAVVIEADQQSADVFAQLDRETDAAPAAPLTDAASAAGDTADAEAADAPNTEGRAEDRIDDWDRQSRGTDPTL